MSASYLVRRRDSYHFRIRVPADLLTAIGAAELKGSLGPATRKAASLRASVMAQQAHAFFESLRELSHLTKPETAALADDWRQRIFSSVREYRCGLGTHASPGVHMAAVSASGEDGGMGLPASVERHLASPVRFRSARVSLGSAITEASNA